jgi:large subunit ribosomal protein L1
MATAGRKILEAKKKLGAGPFPIEEAIKKLKELSFAKFDETVELAINLGVNPKHADQMVRGTILLPHGIGKEVKVAVVASGEKSKEAEEAGADVVGGEDLVKKIQGGFLDFDTVVATPDMMKLVGSLGKVLGPRGMMPNPKTGTVTFDVGKVVQEVKAGRVEYRVDKGGVIHCPVGKVSFEDDKIRENVIALIDRLLKVKPSSAKGRYLKKVTISSTMGPGIVIEVSSVNLR